MLFAGSIAASGSHGAALGAGLGALPAAAARFRTRRAAAVAMLAVAVGTAAALGIQKLPGRAAGVQGPIAPRPGTAIAPRTGFANWEASHPLDSDIGALVVGPDRRLITGGSGRSAAWHGALDQAQQRPLARTTGSAPRATYSSIDMLRSLADSRRTPTSDSIYNSGCSVCLLLRRCSSRSRAAAAGGLRGHRPDLAGALRGVMLAGFALAIVQSYIYSVGNIATATLLDLGVPAADRGVGAAASRMNEPAPRRPRLLVLNQYYWPGVEATAHLLSDLCAALADDFDVTVVTGRSPRRRLAGPRRARGRRDRPRTLDGVRPQPPSRRAAQLLQLPRRLASSGAAAPAARRRALHDRPAGDRRRRAGRRPPVRACRSSSSARTSSPRSPSSWAACENPARRPPAARADRRLPATRRPRGRDRRDDAAASRAPRAPTRTRIRVIPNWVDTTALAPRPRDNDWAREQGFEGRFVVMHSGNVGHAQNLDSLIRAGDLPARPRRPHDRDHRRRRSPRRAGGAGRGAPGRRRALSRLPAARDVSRCPSRRRTCMSSGSHAGSRATSCRAVSTGSSPQDGP